MAEPSFAKSILGLAPWPLLASSIDCIVECPPDILTLVCSIAFVLATPFFLQSYKNGPEVTIAGYQYLHKFVACAVLLSLETEVLVDWTEVSNKLWTLSFVSACASCLSCICLIVVVLLEHSSTLRSSAALSIWLTLSVVCNTVRTRSYVEIPHLHHILTMTIWSTVARLAILIMEEFPKPRRITSDDPHQETSNIRNCGFWSRTFLYWYDYVTFGFRHNTDDGVPPALDAQLASKDLSESFSRHWDSADKTSPHCLLKALLHMTKVPVFEIFVPRLCLSVFFMMQVPFIQHLLAKKETSELTLGDGVGLTEFAILMCFGITVSRATFNRLCTSLQLKLRAMILGQIHPKILSCPFPRVSEDAAMAMINDTLDEFLSYIPILCDALTGVFEIVFCLYFLSAFVGHGAIVTLLPALLSNVAGWFIGKYYPAARMAWQSSMNARVEYTSATLSQLKAIKMVNLQGAIFRRLCKLQEDCISKFITYRYWGTIVTIIDVLCGVLPGAIAITGCLLWTSTTGELTSRDAFTILTTISLLHRPLFNVLSIVRHFNFAASQLHQIQTLLTEDNVLQLADLDNPLPYFGNGIENSTAHPSGEEKKTNQITGTPQKHQTKGEQPTTAQVCESPAPQLPSSPNFVIEFMDASIAARGTESIVLNNLNISIARGELVMVVGPTGCGKSTLLGGIVGDAHALSGKFYKEPGKVAYCDQEPWLYQASIAANIVGKAPFDLLWYRDVLQACLLIDDLKSLIRSDQSLTGPDGSNLSSGQAHRVALARALYLKAPIIILDDIFAALDRRTANQIFAKLFGDDGLLRKFPTTVVMATQPGPWLQAADCVVFIDSHGMVTTRKDHNSPEFRHQLRLLDADPNNTVFSRYQTSTTGRCITAPTPSSKEENKPSGQESFSQSVAVYLSTFDRLSLIPLAIYLVLSSITDSIQIGFVRIWIDIDPKEQRFLYGYACIAFIGVATSALGIRQWCLKVDAVAAAHLHRKYLSEILRAKMHFLTQTDHATIMELFNDGMRLGLEKLSRQVVLFLNVAVGQFTGICVAAAATPFTTPLVALLPAGFYVAWHCFSKVLARTEVSKRKTERELAKHFIETATGQRHIQNLGWKQRTLNEGRLLVDACQQPFHDITVLYCWLSLFVELLGRVSVVVLVLAAVWSSQPSTSGIGAALATALSWSDYSAQQLKYCYEAKKAFAQFSRFTAFSQSIPIERILPRQEVKLPSVWPLHGRVTMQNVTAKYSSQGPTVLRDVSFSVLPGHKAGIVGRTGSGKSSVLMTLLNFLDYDGTIKIDGIDIKTVPRLKLRASITTISHEQILLHGTVRYNLYPWRTSERITNKQLIRVLRSLGLWGIIQRRGGLNAPLSRIGLSFGQKQLLAIGRGILHKLENDTKVVIMDETTSSLDLGTEKTVQRAISKIFGSCTIFVVAHHQEILEDADTILYLKDGNLVKQTYPQIERTAAAEARAQAERNARRRLELEHVENNVEVEGGQEFDGDDEAGDEDDDDETEKGSVRGPDDQEDTEPLDAAPVSEEDAWIGVQPGNVPSLAPAIQDIVTYMETPRETCAEDEEDNEEDLGDMLDYFYKRKHPEKMGQS